VPAFTPGQFVSVRGRAGTGEVIQPRQYSLSDAPNGEYLRLSIKRERGTPDGLISNWMHDTVTEGALVELSPPFGDFVLNDNHETPLVLISGGVGLTPMVSMLNQVVQTQPQRQVVFVHGVRHGGVHALKAHVRDLAARHSQLSVKVFYEQADNDDRPGHDYDHLGRVDLKAIGEHISLPDADYYICGPVPFMQAQIASLKAAGISETRIHYEVFGSHVAAAA
jgi:nitric oxide dioxygenase